ncbi:carbohydrate ABC transporter permease [Armatimonas rosea]|uniref:Multiple sugar transport system permease protein n=1 Tax=Armatimonas rosea TaxID=685828 RepID=A0A7W9SW80_ARMRO|nr:carbohydrate ABC transporter permease [Armatimonas rosea]MBB6054007.1 multiple sugar transport system permease protein [Armatimonas rosea]
MRGIRYAVLVALSLLFLAPFLFMLSTSLKTPEKIFTATMEWIPSPVVWKNYPDAIARFPFWRYVGNTLFICALTVLGTVLSSSLAAYAFARLRFKAREPLFFLMLATIMLPAQVTLLPTFLLFRALGWSGSWLPLIVPAFFGNPFSIFLLRQFFLTIPQELSDAARLDGCTDFGIFWRVLIPLARPALATVALFAFLGAWTDFQGPLIYLHDESQYTLALGLQSFLGRHESQWNLLMATSTVITVPLIIVFLLVQKTFVKGIVLSGLKG